MAFQKNCQKVIDTIHKIYYILFILFLKGKGGIHFNGNFFRSTKAYNNLLHSKKFKQVAGKRLGSALLVFLYISMKT